LAKSRRDKSDEKNQKMPIDDDAWQQSAAATATF
jgi:hypothetical protein